MKKVYLVLDDGPVLEGTAFGADGETSGELVFTTGVVGYPETLTDPRYAGQIVMQTFPLIGCYGIIPEDLHGPCAVRGYVVRDYCETPSNFRCRQTLNDYLREQGVPGVCGVDTRELTRILRERGTVRARITSVKPTDTSVPVVAEASPVDAWSVKEKQSFPLANAKYRVVVVDYGCASALIPVLHEMACEVCVLPHSATGAEILREKPDGVILSEGPGDPAACVSEIEEIARLAGSVPVFAIGLGHQILALSQGGKTEKLPYGHRGTNHPVRDQLGTRTYITSQNHGYTLTGEIPEHAILRFVSQNDGSCEGLEYPSLRAISVQFTPAACVCGADKDSLFTRFLCMMGGED